jgi:uncharacterized membrane protein
VLRLDFDRGAPVVAKRAPQGGLDTEAFMLAVLAERSELPVPALLHADDTLLLMELVPGRTGLDARAQADAAHHVAALHAVRGPAFGLERDTLIGPLTQPNAQSDSWIAFFRDRRLLYAADRAQQAGNLAAGQRRTLDRLAARLDELLEEPAHPALLHGDLWTGNVLAGFAGVLIVVQPGTAAFQWAGLVALLAAACYALMLMTARKYAASESALSLVVWSTLGTALLTGVVTPFQWVPPATADLPWFLAIGVLGGLTMLLLTRAFQLAPAAVVAPFDYTAMLWAVGYGWLVWRDVPAPSTWLGSAVIVGAGLYVMHREGRRRS